MNRVKAAPVNRFIFTASTMRADKNGLARYLNDFADELVYAVHCAGHKIQVRVLLQKLFSREFDNWMLITTHIQFCFICQLILKALAQQRTYHKQLHKLLNLLHSFYAEHNRRMQFYKTAKSLGKKPRLVKRIFEIRDYTYMTSLPSGAPELDNKNKVYCVLCLCQTGTN